MCFSNDVSTSSALLSSRAQQTQLGLGCLTAGESSSRTYLSSEQISAVDEMISKLGILLEKVSGEGRSDELVSKLDETTKKLAELKSIVDAEAFKLSSAKLRTTFFSLGRLVAAHPEKKAFRYHFWAAVKLAAPTLAWPPKTSQVLAQEMFYAEFDGSLVKKIALGFFGASGWLFGYVASAHRCWEVGKGIGEVELDKESSIVIERGATVFPRRGVGFARDFQAFELPRRPFLPDTKVGRTYDDESSSVPVGPYGQY